MSTINVTEDQLTVRLSWLDKALGLLRDQDVPRSAVTSVDVVPDGFAAVRGIRAPGSALPGRRVGTWRRPGPRASWTCERASRRSLWGSADGATASCCWGRTMPRRSPSGCAPNPGVAVAV